MDDKLVFSKDTNSHINILNEIKLIVFKKTNNLSERFVESEKLVRVFNTIFSSKKTSVVFLYLLEHGACTSYTLQVHLDISKDRTYVCLKKLSKLGLVFPVRKIPKHRNKRGGPRPHVWALVGATRDDIARAIRIHYRSQSPKYRVAEEIANSFITDYLSKRGIDEIGYTEVFNYIKEKDIPFLPVDIAQIASDYLREQGIKVWR